MNIPTDDAENKHLNPQPKGSGHGRKHVPDAENWHPPTDETTPPSAVPPASESAAAPA